MRTDSHQLNLTRSHERLVEEESEFQRVHYAPRPDKPAPETTVQVSEEKASNDPGTR